MALIWCRPSVAWPSRRGDLMPDKVALITGVTGQDNALKVPLDLIV